MGKNSSWYLFYFIFLIQINRLNFRKFMIIYVQCRYCKCGRTRQYSCSSIGQSLTVCHSLWLPLDKILVHELSIKFKKKILSSAKGVQNVSLFASSSVLIRSMFFVILFFFFRTAFMENDVKFVYLKSIIFNRSTINVSVPSLSWWF